MVVDVVECGLCVEVTMNERCILLLVRDAEYCRQVMLVGGRET